MQDFQTLLEQLRAKRGMLGWKIESQDLLPLCEHFAVLKQSAIQPQILTLSEPPPIKLPKRKFITDYGYVGELISMRNDFRACSTMQDFFVRELCSRPEFADYTICDVGFWDLDISSDSGFSWHNDNNWNEYIIPQNRTYHGWFVYSATDDCNTTLAVSGNVNYNGSNSNVVLGITDIDDDDAIKPDLIAPLHRGSLALFPVGACHRTYRFKAPEVLAGHRLCVSFIMHHNDDGLNEEKLANLSDDELCKAFARYPIEKAFQTGHYMVQLLERHPRVGPLLSRIKSPATTPAP
ncbi:MAG: hypothetical protein SFX73_19525 [Kofleriaceae bacterium]|nr:hypothetical protein [Kofleriaceae bacterium]